jgi:hypothetical protein
MKIFASVIYRVLVPKYFRTKILEFYLPKQILKYYQNNPEKNTKEIEHAVDYLRRKPIAVFPYDFQDEYIAGSIEVFRNPDNNLPYVMHHGKRLYFKRRWGIKKIRHLYNLLSKEQDVRSAHRYLAGAFTFEKGEILVDAGVAEGNFALDVVEKASKLILFEADREWIEPLQATFAPWRDKVQIINKFVGNFTDSEHIRIDDIVLPDEVPVFLKIDVEGAEKQLIEGCRNLLANQRKIKVAIATYHQQNDGKEFSDLFNELGFNLGFSAGFMLFFYDKRMREPYFRRGLMRAVKN